VNRSSAHTSASLARLEREKISQRTKAGLERARARGERLGRPAFSTKEREKKRIRRRLERNRKFADSPLEGDGFELLVRERVESGCRACLPWTGRPALFADRFYRVPDRRLRVRQSRWPGRSAGCRPVPSNRARQKARQPDSPRSRTRSSNPSPSGGESADFLFLSGGAPSAALAAVARALFDRTALVKTLEDAVDALKCSLGL
jgi:hypothetical protein